jgi:hypothetical protein
MYRRYIKKKKNPAPQGHPRIVPARRQWFTPVTLATQEVEIRTIEASLST